MRVAPRIELTASERRELEHLARSNTVSVRLARRAHIVLLAAEGKENDEIGQMLGVGRIQVGRWRGRYAQGGGGGGGGGGPPGGATLWGPRPLAPKGGVGESSILRVWHRHALKPHLIDTFKVSRDPHFVQKLEDIVGLYLNPPEHAIVLCCDEKSQVQALDRTQPGLPLKKGRAATMTHDYKRHGTTTLFAALNTLDGSVISCCQNRHRHEEWMRFLRRVDRQTPKEKELHLVCDNYGTHKHPEVQEWLARHPRFHMHFTPTSASWLNMVERFFRSLTTDRLRRGVFRSVPELTAAIEEDVRLHNETPKPFIWTAKAADILQKVIRANRRLSSKQNEALH